MLAPWVLLPVILALARRQGILRVLAARSAVAVALMGAVNAVATLTGCLAAVIWWAAHRPNKLWWRFTAWWALCTMLAVLWWVVALVMLGRISPPFLDFIESSGVTTQWLSLTEVLRGTYSWTPFVAPGATAGASLVIELGGGAGDDAGRRGGHGRVWPCGRCPRGGGSSRCCSSASRCWPSATPASWARRSPQQVQAFLDGAGTPLRNVHKLEPLIRLPLVLGLAHLLRRVPLPGQRRAAGVDRARTRIPSATSGWPSASSCWSRSPAGTSLAWTGRLTPPGGFTAIPDYWHEAADWLDVHNQPAGPRARRARRPLRHPGLGHQPRRAAAGARQQPVGGARLHPADAAGDHPRAGFGAATVRRGTAIRRTGRYPCPARYFVRRRAQRPRSGDVAVGAAAPRPPRHRGLARAVEGRAVRRPDRAGDARRASSPTADCGRCIRRSRSTGSTARPSPLSPYLADVDAMARVDGGPEALLRLNERRRLLGQPPLGPMLLTADAQRAGLAVPVVTVTDTPVARETDYGRVDDHLSAIRAPGDARHTYNRVHGLPGGRRRRRLRSVARRTPLGVEFGGGFDGAAQRRDRGRARRGHRRRPVDQLGVEQPAVGRRAVAAGRLRPSDHQRGGHHHARAPLPLAHRSTGSR